ncbi:PilZ domain-containing protein [Sphingomonas hankyongi]|uniref:PilZ domain-containing protein n=1 Tax=Sphingomonas hankyongi TaxID=2908209 RepID=A0ABT0RZ64_9SPHN|nr:PilZ domain-containing protein [Sphingomonas hankyongi]MCL6728585.1 PilZ domain-containing protein [Sphingomonas hankyongi]
MNIRAKVFGGKAEKPEAVLAAKKPKGAQTDLLHSVAVRREETRRGNTRVADRHRLADEQASVIHGEQSFLVELVNVSGGGAMISASFEPMLWDRVDLHLGDGGVIEAVVRWLKGDRIGLEFAHETRIECSPDEQAAILRDTITRSFPNLEFEAPDARPQQEADVGEEGRRERRHPLIWTAQLHHDYQTAQVRLRNISATGALIECDAPPRVGAEPLLDFGEAGTVFATVSWVVGDQAGLRFHSPFDLSLLARSRPDVAPVRWDRPDYLGSSPAADSPWAEEWGRMSLSELRDELEGFMKR